MKTGQLTFDDLKAVLKELRDRYPKFTDDERFVFWFLRAYVTDSDEQAANAVIGESSDKGVDALLVDDAARAVFVIQAKYRHKLEATSEGRNDVMAFAEVGVRLNDPNDSTFESYLANASDLVGSRLREARKKVRKEKYRIWLYFVTTGKVSPAIRKDVQEYVRQTSNQSRIEVISGSRAMLLFRDYLDGVAPPIPTLDLELENRAGVTVNGVAQRMDHRSNVESWVFSMGGDAVAALYERGGARLFARNIRGFLGMNTPVNDGMVATLKDEPERFFYYNNGVTIICDEAERKSAQGRDYLQVSNPQVINGQQTTRTLAAYAQLAGKASVLVKVIRVPRADPKNATGFEELVSRVVAGTNWQNAITPSDLMSNDRRQIDLERSLRKVGYLYLRKRQTKGEARALVGGKQFYIVKKEEFAQAVAGCELDPAIIPSGRERLFEEEHYPQVFPNSDPDFYLSRYRLLREVAWHTKQARERVYSKWVVLNLIWSQLSKSVRGPRKCRSFRILCERQDNGCVVPLSHAISSVFEEALRYYRNHRGKGEEAEDIRTFFKRVGHHKRFADHWDSIDSSRRTKFDKCMSKVVARIESADQ